MTDTKDDKVMRSFSTGATRDTAEGKLDMEGFTHPLVMKQFAKYMNMNRLQSDGQLRDSDNWQKGIPTTAYMKSLKRHCDEVWENHRGFKTEAGMIAALCGIMFNSMGYLLEYLKERDWKLQDFDGDEPTPEMKERQRRVSRDKGEGVNEEKCQIEVHGQTGPPVMGLIAFDEEYSEQLEDVPELPVCFGECDDFCHVCRDTAECESTICEPEYCDFWDECEGEIKVKPTGHCIDCAHGRKSFNENPCRCCIRNENTEAILPQDNFEGTASAKYHGCKGCLSYYQIKAGHREHFPCSICKRNKESVGVLMGDYKTIREDL
jgi:hypothetical protein